MQGSSSSSSRISVSIHTDSEDEILVLLCSGYDWVDPRVKAYLSRFRWSSFVTTLAKSVEMILEIVDDDIIRIKWVGTRDNVCYG